MEETSKLKLLSPKRCNRFRVDFPEDFGIPSWFIKSVTHPSYNVTKKKWWDMEVFFQDTEETPISKILYDLKNRFDKTHFDSSVSKPIFSFNINILNSVGVEIEKWEINVKEVKYIVFGDVFDYESINLQTPRLVLTPMNCKIVS